MVDLCDMMSSEYDDNTESLRREELHVEETEDQDGLSSTQLGMVLGFADMLSSEKEDQEAASAIGSVELASDFESEIEKISLKSRGPNIPAFEQHVYKTCGIM